MIYLFLADGFEEIEALAPVDFLRRCGVEVKTVSIGETNTVKGSHGIFVNADMNKRDAKLDDDLQGVILPGGMPGSKNLDQDAFVEEALAFANKNNLLIGAICAAPFVLGKRGLLEGKNATCFPGFENELLGAAVCDKGVVADGNIVTAAGAGVAWEFGCELASYFVGREKAKEVLGSLQWRR